MKITRKFSLILTVLTATALSAKCQSAVDNARTGEVKQTQIQNDSQKILADLDAMIDEYERNGLRGDDVKNLKSLRGILSHVGGDEMKKILTLLQDAAAKNDPKTALRAIADAYSQQKGVVVQLKQIAASYANDQEALELSKSVKELAERQAANLQTGIETGQWSLAGGNKTQDAVDASLQGQSAEQKAIGDELTLLQKKIDEFARNPSNAALADRYKKGLDESATIPPLLTAATDSLDQKKLFEAVTTEKDARDRMRQLARTLSPPRDEAEALRDADQKIAKLIEEQKDIISHTGDLPGPDIQKWLRDGFKGNDPFLPKWLASVKLWPAELSKSEEDTKNRQNSGAKVEPVAALVEEPKVKDAFEGAKRAAAPDFAGLENHQGDVASQTDLVSQDITEVGNAKATAIAEALKAAMVPMQGARTELTNQEPVKALDPERAALALMEKAEADLQDRIAQVEKGDEETGDKLTDLKELQKQTEDLLAKQTALTQETATPQTPQQAAAEAQQQANLEKKTEDVQQQATATAPEAAQTLDNAAKNMDKAAGEMKAPAQTPQATQDQTKAQGDLAKANDQLKKEIDKLTDAEKQLAAIDKALDELQKIIEAQQKLEIETAQAAPQQEKKRPDILAMEPRQKGIQTDTSGYQKTLADAEVQQANAAETTSKLTSAAGHMGDSDGHLGKGDGVSADPDEIKALADLNAMKDALEAQAKAEEAQLGQDPTAKSDQATADAAAAVAQAQADLAQAMSAMAGEAPNQSGSNGDQNPAGQLDKAAEAVGDAAAKADGLPPGADQAMSQAASALAQAAGQAAAGQNTPAQASGQQAAQALAQAAAALAQAQSGVASTPSEGPPSENTGPPGKLSNGKGSSQTGGETKTTAGRVAAKNARFLNLPASVRGTIQQAESEKYPPQYASKVQQYLQNLSDDSSVQ